MATKTITMSPKAEQQTENKETNLSSHLEKMSREELINALSSSLSQNESMYNQLQKMNQKLQDNSNTWAFARLDYLMKYCDPKYDFPGLLVDKAKAQVTEMLALESECKACNTEEEDLNN